MTRNMQSTNGYEHSPDSAMRPVRPDGISRRTREHPCDAHLSKRAARHGDLDPTTTCGVSVKTASEIESVATRPRGPVKRSISPRRNGSRSYPIRTPGCSPRLATNGTSAHRRLERCTVATGASSDLPRGEASAPFSCGDMAPFRFCHRGYPASTEPHTSSTSSDRAAGPPLERGIGRTHRKISMTSDSGNPSPNDSSRKSHLW